MPKTQHIHKLKRHRFKSGNEVYFCTLPDCNLKMDIALSLGKRAICWRCGESFIMNEYSIRLAKPHCESCHMPKIKLIDIPESDNDKLVFDLEEKRLSLSERLTKTIQEQQNKEEDI